MGDPGLPDNWGPSIRCGRCGGLNHPSGTVACRCPELDEEASEETTDLVRIAEERESRGDWAGAARAYEGAANVARERAG